MKAALGLLIAAQLLAAPAVANVAEYTAPEAGVEFTAEGKNPTRQEEFIWYFRMYNGREQMRLWSITYGYWVTDWIDCD